MKAAQPLCRARCRCATWLQIFVPSSLFFSLWLRQAYARGLRLLFSGLLSIERCVHACRKLSGCRAGAHQGHAVHDASSRFADSLLALFKRCIVQVRSDRKHKRVIDRVAEPHAALAQRAWACTVARALYWLRDDNALGCSALTFMHPSPCSDMEVDGNEAPNNPAPFDDVLRLDGADANFAACELSPHHASGSTAVPAAKHSFVTRWWATLAQLELLQEGVPEQGLSLAADQAATTALRMHAPGSPVDEMRQLATIHAQIAGHAVPASLRTAHHAEDAWLDGR